MLWDITEENRIQDEIKHLHTNDLKRFFDKHITFYSKDYKAFSSYMRSKFREKGISQKDAFKRANISEGYGYKIISQEKKTAQRDVILRLCLALRMSIDETQKALMLGGFSILCINYRRDVVIMVAINNHFFSIEEVNKFLTKYGEEMLFEGFHKEY